jgi:hypothetical protein
LVPGQRYEISCGHGICPGAGSTTSALDSHDRFASQTDEMLMTMF